MWVFMCVCDILGDKKTSFHSIVILLQMHLETWAHKTKHTKNDLVMKTHRKTRLTQYSYMFKQILIFSAQFIRFTSIHNFNRWWLWNRVVFCSFICKSIFFPLRSNGEWIYIYENRFHARVQFRWWGFTQILN